METISIIIPVFNQVTYTEHCLRTLCEDPELGQNVEVIVIDNGSTDDTSSVLATFCQAWSGIRAHRFTDNTGFSRACNAGAEIATGTNLLFLNNDTIPQRGWLSALWRTLQLPHAGIVGPKLLYPDDGTINHCGYVYNGARRSFYPIYHRYPGTFPGASRRRVFQALLGACVLVRREIFQGVGGFSDFGLEDVDLCLKINRRGLHAIFEPESVVFHHGSVTLRNSPAGSIPETDCLGFNRQWPQGTITADDDRYYSEDGLQLVDISPTNVISLREIVGEALRCYAEAQRCKQGGDTKEAIALLEQSISLYRGFEGGYQELIAILLERKERELALRHAERMAMHVASIHKAHLTAAQIAARAGIKDKVLAHTEYLVRDWRTPGEIRAQAEEVVRTAV